MRKKKIAIIAFCLATVVSQAPVASAQVKSDADRAPGFVSNAFKCC